MTNSDLEQKMNAILNSDYSLERKIEQIFGDLKPTGTQEEQINFIIYWINLLIEEDGTYNLINYNDLQHLFPEILGLINMKGPKDYNNYYGIMGVLMQKIMNEIISKSNKQTLLEPSSLITIQKVEPTYEEEPVEDKLEDRIKAIKNRYEELAFIEIEHLKTIEKIKELQDKLKTNETRKEEILNDISSLTKNNGGI